MATVRSVLRDPFFLIAAFFVLLPSFFQLLWGMEGNVMIASPKMQDKIFRQSVVYISDHTIDGAVGFILNKPYLIERPKKISDFPGAVFWGGPLKDRDAVYIFYFKGAGAPLVRALEDWQRQDAGILSKAASEPDKYRVIIGFCGWQALQLDLERLKKGWVVDGVRRSQVISAWSSEGGELWKKTLEASGYYKKSSLARRIGT